MSRYTERLAGRQWPDISMSDVDANRLEREIPCLLVDIPEFKRLGMLDMVDYCEMRIAVIAGHIFKLRDRNYDFETCR